MYVCICNAITDRDIRDAVSDGASNLWDLQQTLGVATGCGSCAPQALDVLSEHRQVSRPVTASPRVYSPVPA